MIKAGVFCLFCGFVAGYILHGWEFNEKLREVEQKYDALERRLLGIRRMPDE